MGPRDVSDAGKDKRKKSFGEWRLYGCFGRCDNRMQRFSDDRCLMNWVEYKKKRSVRTKMSPDIILFFKNYIS